MDSGGDACRKCDCGLGWLGEDVPPFLVESEILTDSLGVKLDIS